MGNSLTRFPWMPSAAKSNPTATLQKAKENVNVKTRTGMKCKPWGFYIGALIDGPDPTHGYEEKS